MKIISNRPGAISLRLVTLKRGVNHVDPDVWEKVKGHPIAVDFLNRGVLVVEDAGPDVAPVPTPKPEPKPEPVEVECAEALDTEDMKAADAKAYVRALDDVDHLESLKDGEKRKTVLKAIEDRLSDLDA